MTATQYPHIVRDPAGRHLIAGTRVKLAVLIENHLSYGFSANQLLAQFPDLTLAQAYAALAFYYDNREQVDQEIHARRAKADAWIAQQQPSPARERLRAVKSSSPQ